MLLTTANSPQRPTVFNVCALISHRITADLQRAYAYADALRVDLAKEVQNGTPASAPALACGAAEPPRRRGVVWRTLLWSAHARSVCKLRCMRAGARHPLFVLCMRLGRAPAGAHVVPLDACAACVLTVAPARAAARRPAGAHADQDGLPGRSARVSAARALVRLVLEWGRERERSSSSRRLGTFAFV